MIASLGGWGRGGGGGGGEWEVGTCFSRSASLDVISASHFSSSHNTMHGVLYNTPMKACPDEWDLPP